MISTSCPRGGRPLVEDALRLRVADLRPAGEWVRYHRLTAGDGTVIRCRVEVGEGLAAWLHVEHWPQGSAWATSSYTVSLGSTPQHVGGRRWWLDCPMSGVRCSTLFLPLGAKRFASWQAHGLAHRSQRQRAPVRAAARAAEIRADLGGDGSVRPKGMWGRTFARRLDLLASLEARSAKTCAGPI